MICPLSKTGGGAAIWVVGSRGPLVTDDRFDAHLTEEGWKQAEDLNRHIVNAGLKVDLVVVSPLSRALETAVGAFARCAHWGDAIW